MRIHRFARAGCVLAICITWSLGQTGPQASAASPASPAATQTRHPAPVTDVALSPDGRLYGQVIARKGAPLAGLPVAITDASLVEVSTETDEQGRFAFSMPRGGIYAVRVGSVRAVYRVWTNNAAPPGAAGWVSIRLEEPVIRGQSSPAYQWISEHPWLFYTGLAAAITVPLVVATSRRDTPSSP